MYHNYKYKCIMCLYLLTVMFLCDLKSSIIFGVVYFSIFVSDAYLLLPPSLDTLCMYVHGNIVG